MKTRLTLAVIASLLAAMFLFAACTAPAAPADAPADDSWEYIKSQGKLIVGLDDTFAPMGFRDEAGELIGFDIDMAKAAGKLMGVEIVFQPVDWDSKELELENKKIDCIWNGLSLTPTREEELNMSNAYLNNVIAIMSVDDVSVTKLEDLEGLTIGTQAASAALEAMQASDIYSVISGNVSEYPSYDDVIMDMQAGRIQVMVVDLVLGEYKNSKLDAPFTVSSVTFGDDLYAIGMRKGDDALTAKINETLKTLIENGTAAKISEEWFGRDIVIK